MDKKSFLGKGLLLLGLVVFVAVVGAYFWMQSYIKSEKFNDVIAGALSQKLGGEVEIAPTQWDGWGVSTEQIAAPMGIGFEDLRVERLSLEIDPRGFFDRVWRVPDVHVRELAVQVGGGHEPVAAESTDPELSAPKQESARMGWLPRTAEVDYVKVDNFHGRLHEQLQWDHVGLQLSRESEDYLYQLTQGELVHQAMPQLQWVVRGVKGRLKKEEFFLNEGQFTGAGQSQLSLSGEGDYQGGLNLAGQLQALPLSEVLKEDWQKRVKGALEMQFTVVRDEQMKIEGTCEVLDGMLTALPILDKIADKTKVQNFRQIQFDTLTSEMTHVDGVTQFSNIQAISTGLLKATGEYTRDGKQSWGEFQVGIHESVMKRMPIGSKKVFSEQRDGHYWTSIKVSESDGVWKEDLSGRVLPAIAMALLQAAPDTAAGVLQGAASLISGDEDKGIRPSDVLETGEKLIETGVKSLFDLLGD